MGPEKLDRFLPFHKEQILKIKVSARGVPDELVWLKNSSGDYSTPYGYLILNEELMQPVLPDPTKIIDLLGNVWNLKTSEKIKFFI